MESLSGNSTRRSSENVVFLIDSHSMKIENKSYISRSEESEFQRVVMRVENVGEILKFLESLSPSVLGKVS